jgi:tRNA A37 threonylcarbamoyladenosine dehydratase
VQADGETRRLCALPISRSRHTTGCCKRCDKLRKEFGFARGEKEFGIDAVYSPEPPVFPAPDGTVCSQREPAADGGSLRLNCDSGFGTATFVTGTFGFVAAAHVVQRIANGIQRKGAKPDLAL